MGKAKKKTILIFIDWFSPGYKAGGPVSSNVNLIAHLKKEFQFKVITRNTEYMEIEPYPGITPDQWIPMGDFEGYYSSPNKLSLTALQKLIGNTTFDIAYVNGVYSWYFSVLPLILLKFNRKKVIVSARGMLSPHALAVKSFKKSSFLHLCRFLGLYRNVSFHATNEEEASNIRKVAGSNCKIWIAPNLPKITIEGSSTLVKSPGNLHLIYVGRIAPEKNTLFAIQLLQQLSGSFRGRKLTLSIYGSIYSNDYWQQCRTLIARLPENIEVDYKGTVEPSQIPNVLKQHHFLFLPTLGENYGHTIAESLQNGVPVIISDRTPWRNLNSVKNSPGVGWDISLELPERFIEVLEYCAAMGQDEYTTMSRLALEYAKQITEDPGVVEANRKLFENNL